MKEQNKQTTPENTVNLEKFMMNIWTKADNEYNSYTKTIDKLDRNDDILLNFRFTCMIIGGVGTILGFCFCMDSNIGLIFLILSMIFLMLLPIIIDAWRNFKTFKQLQTFENEINKLDSIYHHDEIIELEHSKPHMLLLLKYLLNPNKYSFMNIKSISDILLKNDIKHRVKEVDNNFTLIIYFENKEYMIASSSLLSTTLTMPDNLRLDVLEICNLEKSLSNESDWDEIVKYIKKHNDIEKERTMMNHINELNNISV